MTRKNNKNLNNIYVDEHKKIRFQGSVFLERPITQTVIRTISSKKFWLSCLIAGIAAGLILYYVR